MQKSENFGGLAALWPLRGTVQDMRFTYIRYLSGLGCPVRGRRRSSQEGSTKVSTPLCENKMIFTNDSTVSTEKLPFRNRELQCRFCRYPGTFKSEKIKIETTDKFFIYMPDIYSLALI
jgi:hypothetical protein